MSTQTRRKQPLTQRILLSAVAAAGVVALGWMLLELVKAIIRLVTLRPPTAPSETVSGLGDLAYSASIPLFLLDNGSVAVAASDGWFAMGGQQSGVNAVAWAAAAQATASLTVIVVIVAVLLLCIRLLRGIPFGRVLTRIVAVAGIALIAGSAFSQLFGYLSRHEMIATVADTVALNGWRIPDAGTPIDLVPLACGVVLLIVALAFSSGDRLRRDTDGLV